MRGMPAACRCARCCFWLVTSLKTPSRPIHVARATPSFLCVQQSVRFRSHLVCLFKSAVDSSYIGSWGGRPYSLHFVFFHWGYHHHTYPLNTPVGRGRVSSFTGKGHLGGGVLESWGGVYPYFYFVVLRQKNEIAARHGNSPMGQKFPGNDGVCTLLSLYSRNPHTRIHHLAYHALVR
ncbi:unnamed protein product [Ectocarpus sp. 12 AP-2014]